MKNLYELGADYNQVQEMMESEELDIQMLKDTLEAIEGSIEVKADNIAKWMKNNESSMAALDLEIKRLTSRKKTLENKNKSLKDYLKSAMEITKKTNLKTTLFTFYIRKNKASVVLDDISAINKRYKEVVKTTKIDKVAIAADIKAGKHVAGVHTTQSESLVIQ